MPTESRAKTHLYPVLLMGILAVAASPIIVRYAQGEALPTLLIAAGRLILASLILTPLTLRAHRADLALLNRRDFLLAIVTGIFLAIHFITWIASLEYTTVLVSVVLVTTSPLWVALIEVVFLRAHIRRLVIAGLVVAFIGGLLISVAGSEGEGVGSAPLLGGGLALLGAITFAIYLTAGRKLRAKLPLLPYIWLVYGSAAIFLLLLVIVTGTLVTGFSTTGYLLIVLLAVLPQLIGHSSFNYALRFVSATYVSIATQMEPIFSAIGAYFLLGEVPRELQVVGSAAILIGVLLATLGQEKAAAPEAAVVEAAEDVR